MGRAPPTAGHVRPALKVLLGDGVCRTWAWCRVLSHLDTFSEAILSTVESLNKNQPEVSLAKPFV